MLISLSDQLLTARKLEVFSSIPNVFLDVFTQINSKNSQVFGIFYYFFLPQHIYNVEIAVEYCLQSPELCPWKNFQRTFDFKELVLKIDRLRQYSD